MRYLHRLLAAALSAAFFMAGSALAQNAGTVTNHAFALGKGPGVTGYTSLLCGSAQLAVGQAAADPICRTITGDVTISAAGVTALGNIPTGTTAAGSVLASNTAAPSSPAAGKVLLWTDSTDLRFHDKNASGVIGTTVVADTGAANNFLTAISAAGAISKARPSCASLSDASVFCNGTSAANLTGAVAIGNGGTGQTTASAARGSSGLNVDSFTGHGDSIYTILATDRTVGTNAAFTASRTWTLPAANAVNAGQEIIVADFQGTVTGTNTLVISRAGSDTVNGSTSVTMTSANGAYLFKSDGTSKWTAQALGAAAAGGVSSVTCGTGLTGGTITTSGTCAVSLGTASNVLGADVALNNTANYFDGPSMAQGTSGTWFVSGTVTVLDTANVTAAIDCKLWDGTTVYASARQITPGVANIPTFVALSGIAASPAANIRISCKNISSTAGVIKFNLTGNSKDSSVVGVRIQ